MKSNFKKSKAKISPNLAKICFSALLFAAILFLISIILTVANFSPSSLIGSTNELIKSINVLTRSYDNSRLGLNGNETILNTTNVNAKTFGKVFSRKVEGQIYAQPLYVSNLTIPNKGSHNVVFVATQHNSIYAFDADDPKASIPLWEVNLGPSAITPNSDFGNFLGPYQDITPEVGITSTPVIDIETKTLFVVVFSKVNEHYRHELHALDLLSGNDKKGSPKIIEASVNGSSGENNFDKNVTKVTFDSKQQLQRAGLLLVNNQIFIAFAGYGDTPPYHGWIMAYDATTLNQLAVLNITPDSGPFPSREEESGKRGIWMSGQGIAADEDGNIYLATGNGNFNVNNGGGNYGDSAIRLNLSDNTFIIQSYFTPYNHSVLASKDLDFGVGGVILLPDLNIKGQKLALIGSKEGKIYIINRQEMGGICTNCNLIEGDTNITQWFSASSGQLVGGSTVYWNAPGVGPLIYVWGESDYLKAFRFDRQAGKFAQTPIYQSAMAVPKLMPGGVMSISSNGSKFGSGIVWVLHSLCTDFKSTTRQGILRAFDASNLDELWNSEQEKISEKDNSKPCSSSKIQSDARDSLGIQAKFNPPVVVNGKVYVGTFSNELVVYGLIAK